MSAAPELDLDSSPPRLLVGAMSGTSCDGVDAALMAIRGRGEAMTAEYRHHVERPFDPDFRRRLLAVREAGGCSFAELAGIGRELTLAYATAVRDLLAETDTPAVSVAAVAAHGQTLFHDPPNTIQWFDPSLLAAEVGIAVVSDFRRADCAAGGQGAPLVPFADWVLFRHPTKTRVILNLGGIANLTYLPAGGGIKDVIAFDTGPGNCLSDHVMRHRVNLGHDEGGERAVSGAPNWRLANEFIEAMPFFAMVPPKSLDVPELIDVYTRVIMPRFDTASLNDELATCAAIVGLSFGYACVDFLPESEHDLDEIIVCGGGTRNSAMVEHIRNYPAFEQVIPVRESAQVDLPASAREAACFAILGAATLDGEPANVPSATGARRRVVLGSVTPRP